MSFYSTGTRCKCGSSLRKTTPSACYGNGANCDGCRRSISSWATVYHCPKGETYQHSGGYDLCPSCYNGGSSPDQADMIANAIVGQMSKDKSLQQKAYNAEIKTKQLIEQQVEEYSQLKQKYSEKTKEMQDNNQQSKVEIRQTHDMIETYSEKVNEAKQTLSKKRIETATAKSRHSEVQRENSTLQEQILRYYAKIETLKKDGMPLRDENRNLKKKVNKLLDDKKEQEIKIFNLEKELKHFASQNFNLDESKFMEWDHKQLLLWIQRLDNGYFNKYIDVLSIQLKECELSGKDLKHLTTADIRGLGVKKFADAKKLEMYVKKLLGNENKNDNPQIAIQQKEGIFATNYI